VGLGAVMLDLEGLSLTKSESNLLQQPGVGGVIFFARNFESITQIQSLVEQIRAIRPELLLAVDQEGGRVQRFKTGFTRLPAMQQFLPLYRKNPEKAQQLVKDCGWLMAKELLAVGIDFSFAPVLDVDSSYCSVIADRSFSSEPKEAALLANAWIAGMKEAGMATTGKHFPGHGGVSADSHLELPIDTRNLETLNSHDLIPFKEALHELNAVMPAHIVFPAVDQDHSVGFSRLWLQDILRKELGFEGVIFSDDLTMQGAASVGSYTQRATLALEAGCDMLLVCNHRQGALEALAIDKCATLCSQSKSRLEVMRAKTRTTFDALSTDDRWQRTSQFISMVFDKNKQV